MMRLKIGFFLILLFPAFAARAQYVATIDAAREKQVIDGFGASSAWHGRLSLAEVSAAFDNDSLYQLGLSILRVRIDPNSGYWSDERQNAQRAKAKGVKILASPWTPPAALKTNNNVVGGELKPDSYAAYATHLNNFCKYCGVIDVVSLQNEPNIGVTYESCWWNPSQILKFCQENVPAIQTPFMVPEAFNFDKSYSDPVLDDSLANAHVPYIGGHLYGAVPFRYTKAIDKGKKVWMTEHYIEGDDIDACMTLAKEMADCMNDDMNAYVYWWLREGTTNLMASGGALKKKGYAMAHFSKFIRPGYHRIDAPFDAQYKLNLVAFKGNGKTVLVVVNQNPTPRTQTFTLKNDSITGFRKYMTTADKNLSDEGKIVCTDNSFTDYILGKSIVTYVSTDVPVSVSAVQESQIRIYPNPVKDHLRITGLPEISKVRIINRLGQIVLSLKNPASSDLDVSQLHDGFYILSVDSRGTRQNFKFLKKK